MLPTMWHSTGPRVVEGEATAEMALLVTRVRGTPAEPGEKTTTEDEGSMLAGRVSNVTTMISPPAASVTKGEAVPSGALEEEEEEEDEEEEDE